MCSFSIASSSPSGAGFATPDSGLTPGTIDSQNLTSTPNVDTPGSTTESMSLSAPGYSENPDLNLADLELLHNYSTSTSYTLTNVPSLQVFHRINIPQFAFSNSFVLRILLGVSALHLAHFRTGDSRARYLSQAYHHYNLALHTASSLLPSINDESCTALYLFSTMCCFFTMALGPQPGDYLLFGNQGIAEWLVLFRGMRSILECNYETLRHGSLSPLFEISIEMMQQERADNEHLNELRQTILDNAKGDPDLQTYLQGVDSLARVSPPPATLLPGARLMHSSPHLVFACLYFFNDDFTQCLQQRKPIALVVFAHFCVMLNDLSSFWWIQGWPAHLMSEIYGSLNEHYRLWIRWCMEEIGWVPK